MAANKQQQVGAIVQQQQQLEVQPHPRATSQQAESIEKGSVTRQQCIANAKQGNRYCVRYHDNGLKRWDGREIWLDSEFMEELYMILKVYSVH